jgi:hypothetical protein
VGLPEDVSDITVSDLLARYASDKVIVILNWVVRFNDDLVVDPGEKVVFCVYYNGVVVRPGGWGLGRVGVEGLLEPRETLP